MTNFRETVKNLRLPAIILAVFVLGFLSAVWYFDLEVKSSVAENALQGAIVKEEGKPDLSQFWSVWDKVHSNYLKRKDVDDTKLIYGAINGLVDSLGDPNSNFFEPERADKFNQELSGSFFGIGAELGKKDGFIVILAPLPDSPAEKIGLRSKDKILAVDGKPIIGLSVEETVLMIRGERGTDVTLTILRDSFDKPKDFIITRDKIVIPSVSKKMIGDRIGYLKIYNFSGENMLINFYLSAYAIALNNPKAIILDMRDNPGGYFEYAIDIAGWFIPKGEVIVLEKDADGNIQTYRSEGSGAFSEIPVIVLVNSGSASASEIVAGALRDQNKSKLVGEKTFGKGSVQELMKISNGSMLKLTISEWLTPKRISISENGLIPDVEIKNDEEFSRFGDVANDPQLNKAIELLNNQ